MACVTGEAAALKKALADQGSDPNSIWDDGLSVYPKYDNDDSGDAKGSFVG